MQVLGYIISFFPLAVCLVGFFAFLAKKGKSYAQVFFMIAVFLLAIYYLVEGLYAVGSTHYHFLTILDIVLQFVTPAIPILFIAYISSLYQNVVDSENIIIYLIPSAVVGIGALFIYVYIGIDQTSAYLAAIKTGDLSDFAHPIYSIVNFWTMKLYKFVLLTEIAIFFVYISIVMIRHKVRFLNFFRFFFSSGKSGSHKLSTYDSLLVLMFLFVVFYCLRMVIVGRALTAGVNYISWVFSIVLGFIMINCIGIAYLPELNGVTMKGLAVRDFNYTPNPENLVPKAYNNEEYDKMSMNKLALENDAQLLYMSLLQDKYYLEPEASLAGQSNAIGLSKRRINFISATLCGCSYEELLEYCRENYKE